jgi:hypothetical protein
MSKLTALAIGLLTVISIAPQSQAMTTNIDAPSLQQPAANLHSQVILKVSEQPREYSNRRRYDKSEDRYSGHRREWERKQEQKREYEREREAAEHHRHRATPTAIIKIGDIITIKL